jgi:hypothetical protein
MAVMALSLLLLAAAGPAAAEAPTSPAVAACQPQPGVCFSKPAEFKHLKAGPAAASAAGCCAACGAQGC